MPTVEFKNYNIMSYKEALQKQMQLSEEVRSYPAQAHVMWLEHKPVVTLGRRANDVHILNKGVLQSKDFEFVTTDRGGEVTLHHKGQLVIYPILNLRSFNLTVKNYICCLLKATKQTLEYYSIPCESCLERPGVYTPQGKIAFVGIRVDRGVSRHGLSINFNNELSDFSLIKSCGVESAHHDKVEFYRPELSKDDFMHIWSGKFCKQLKLD
jgi:lipoate-protein ligase B